MCGISGIINLNGSAVRESDLRKMMLRIKHRGPDDNGVHIENNVGFGFVRLSILDLSSAGHQPMTSDDGNYVLIFNGEIFNYIEIRSELKGLGHNFETGTDTEVLLKAYQQWGPACQHKFNGMWAFAIHDRKNNKIFISRDRYGIKPFYYFKNHEQFIFASEIPAILEVLQEQPKANNQAIFDFLVYNRTDQNEYTFFEGIRKLNHGHSITIDLTKKQADWTVEKWYDLRANLKEAFVNSKEYYEYLKTAIDLRMRSDVPVGICLSGGLDSSSILSVLLADKGHEAINTFSAVYHKGDVGDETEFINEYASLVKNMHYVMPTGPELFSDLESFVKAQGEPIPSTSSYAQFRVMKLARGKVTVTLEGQGADEQLAGYHYFFGLYYKELLLKFRLYKLVKEIFSYYFKHRSLLAAKSFLFFMLPKKLRTRVRVSEKGYLLPSFMKKYKVNESIAGNLYGSKNLQDAMIDHFEFKMEHHLKWGDFNSMWHSIESRVPFLDHRLVEKSLSMASEQIIKNGSTKFILREAMKGVLPEKIRMRHDKMGFGTPEAEWFRQDDFKKLVVELLGSKSMQDRGIINTVKANELYQKHLVGTIDISKEIWKWIHLELWFREFIDKKR